jgi:predicted ATPase
MLLPAFLSLYAEVLTQAGQTDEGLRVVAEALTLVDTHGERCWQAELLRLKGECLLAQAGQGQQTTDKRHTALEAETCLRQALAVARHQQAKSLELRAAVSLSRLWQHQGKRHDAHRLLAESYGWFTEGFATPDLQEAKTLLEALA